MLAAGVYKGLPLGNLNGTEGAWITIAGPHSGLPAIINPSSALANTVEIRSCSYLALRNLTVDGQNIDGPFGISANGGLNNAVHHILIEGNTITRFAASQQQVGISTKTPTWGWVIRGNRISNVGTGMYLGNSDGNYPFISGTIENNLIEDTIGYNIQIKHQNTWPVFPGIPTGPTTTIVRNNVFIKNDRLSPDGDRPNVYLGAPADTGDGSLSHYEVYGNLFVHNSREALLQAAGRVSIHDNIFAGGSFAAVVLQTHYYPLKRAHVYNNTIYSRNRGVSFGTAALEEGIVTGNLIFSALPVGGAASSVADNITDTFANAALYVPAPSETPGAMDFFPLAGKARGATALNYTKFAADAAVSSDFNGVDKTAVAGSAVFRGAYAGEGTNPGWRLQADIKPAAGATPPPASVTAASMVCSPALLAGGQSASCTVMLSAASTGNTVALTSSNAAVSVPSTVTVPSGSTTATFSAVASQVQTQQTATVSASLNGSATSTVLTVSAPVVAAPSLAGLACTPSSVVSGAAATCTVSLSASTTSATTITLSSSDPAAITPASAVVPAGATSATFTATSDPVSTTRSAVVTAAYDGQFKSTTLTINPAPATTADRFQFRGAAAEFARTTSGAAVTPTVLPAGLTGTLTVRGSGSVAFAPVTNTDGVFFRNGGQQNTNTAFVTFKGVPLAQLFAAAGGEVSFNLKSSYSFAERVALPASNYRCVYDVTDGTTRLFHFTVSSQYNRLIFSYMTGRSATSWYYYVPVGQEDTVFGKGVTANVRITWSGTSNQLYVNGRLVVSKTYTAAVAPVPASFSIGASDSVYGGGYYASDDAIANFEVK